MDVIVDFILLAASGAATVYCFVLSKRLAKLNDMKNGIGASIASMSQALDQTQQVLALAKRNSVESIERLTSLLEEAEKLTPELSHLMDALGELAEITSDEITEARDEALASIDRRRAPVSMEEEIAYIDNSPVRRRTPGAARKVA